MIKGRSRGGPQEERGRKRKETKEINGVDAEDRRMRISTITISRRVIDNKQTKRHVLAPFRREKTLSHREEEDKQILKERYRIGQQDRYRKQRKRESPATIVDKGRGEGS